MATIQGYAVYAAGAELLPLKYETGELRPQDVEVRISHCGVCHSDVHLIDNDWGMSLYPFIPGHEIVGTVSETGSLVKHFQPGDRVGIGWQADSCGQCEWCRRGEENLCAQAQPTCVRRHGGYAEAVRVNARFAVKIPEALESEKAAPLLCGGITVYNPLRTLGVNPSSRVGVIGIGGLGHLALQFARAFGAEVTAFSTSAAKEEEALSFGAHRFVNSRESKGVKALEGTFDLILSTINADQDWSAYVSALRPHGTLCFVGAPPKPVSLPVFPLVSTAKSVCGSNTGSPSRIAEMLDVAARHGIGAKTERFKMADATQAVKRVRKNQVRYRAVLAS
ncbi:NAD(P)-dependent alcohol dehydrogenase [Paracidobacterium acidisoli]|uniref:alcohol dehydrogenase (NADP(+)) n=1 Tax=Paracidobacterium acidisoli TaxID=2303751 RepID=A0A372ISB8_9BACT|nr:NAD(P)-dependent alcohol dehydrogenase [Paracidobacterium acidisoli]MBT9330764.1 NAD(P)-dependent alcohol dehydrogenase [Paracidobacterium acidisoli]